MGADTTIDRSYVTASLLRPTVETLRDGSEIFIVAKIEGGNVTLLSGDAYVGAMIGRLGSVRTVTSVPVNAVTLAAEYARADDLRWARARIDLLERQIAEIEAVVNGGCCLDWRAAVEKIREVLEPPSDEE